MYSFREVKYFGTQKPKQSNAFARQRVRVGQQEAKVANVYLNASVDKELKKQGLQNPAPFHRVSFPPPERALCRAVIGFGP